MQYTETVVIVGVATDLHEVHLIMTITWRGKKQFWTIVQDQAFLEAHYSMRQTYEDLEMSGRHENDDSK